MSRTLNWNSRNVTRGWQRGVTAFYYALGLTDDDFDKPQIGIGVPLLDGNPCNVHAYELARHIANGCSQAGLVGFPFGTPAVSDNITQGRQCESSVAEHDRERGRMRGQRTQLRRAGRPAQL